jgi:hypothetical protein
MSLKQYFDKYRCDKGTLKHRYDRVYEPAFEAYDKEFTLLEIGIFKGASIAATAQYAPSSSIVGIDTFQRIRPENIPALNLDNVGWVKCSSLDAPPQEFLDLVPPGGFDIIIDDGLHTHDAQRQTFENFFPFLHDDGRYFIEDIWPFDVMSAQEKKHHWLVKHPDDWSDEKYELLLKAIEPYNVIKHDLRTGHDPDTYILEIRK